MIPQTLSHYRVVEKIGAGGMGVVYRAHDEQLDRDVALKVLPPGLLADERARRRFRKEALALAKLNHPNIGGIYEFGTAEGCDFLVMELVSGVSLDTKLAAGALPEDEVLRLGTQLADGLQAAHAQDIIHRDLKPGNLRLTHDGRLKILDFGLAEFTQPGDEGADTVTLTKHDYVTGTVPYMAPEQLRGKQADARSDVYSAGVVLYEMVTGKRPFKANSGPQLISAILETQPSPPTSHNRRISPALESILLKALDKNPERRYQSAKELRIDLERVSTGAIPLHQRRRNWTFAAAAAALALVAVLTAVDVGHWHERLFPRPHPASPAARPSRRSVAVLGFTNLSRNPDVGWISTALSEMLTTELAAGEQLRIVPGEDVARMKPDLPVGDAESFGQDTLTKIHNRLGSDLVIHGSYLALGKEGGGKIRLDFRLQDAVAGETIASVSETGTESELFDLVSRSGAELRQKLGVGGVSDADASFLRASLPANTEGARLYSEGLAKLRSFDAIEARDLLQKAVLNDPRHAPSHAALAAAWSALGYDAKAQAEAKQALDLSANLSREERLSVEGRYHELMREWPKAIDVYRTLWEFFPDNLDYGLRLATVETESGNGKAALQTVDAMRRLSPPQGDDARIDLAEAKAAESLGLFKQEQGVAERAASKARIQGNRLVLAQALSSQGWALLRTGEPEKASALFVQAKDLFSVAGDRRGSANVLLLSGNVLYDKGDFDGARKSFEDALVIFREIGARQSMSRALNNIGNVLYDQGKLADAKSYYEQTLAIDRETGSKGGIAGSLGNIANILDAMGDLPGARKMQEASLAAFRDVGDKRGTASTLDNLGNLLVELGDLEGARKRYQEAMAIEDEISYKRGKSFGLAALGDVLADQGDLVEGRKRMEEALAIRQELKEQDMVAQSLTQLAGIALEQGLFADGEALARKAVVQFDQDKSTENGAWANAMLAKNLLASGKLSESRDAAERAVSLSQLANNRFPRFEATLASARVLAASGNPAAATKKVEALLADAKAHGYLGYEFEARLVLGEIEMKSPDTARGRARLASLEKDARARGFVLIANKAAKARR